MQSGRLWLPKLMVFNVNEDDMTSTSTFTLEHNEHGLADVCETRYVRGTFYEKMELSDFPFDCQALTIIITTDYPEHLVHLEADVMRVLIILHINFYKTHISYNISLFTFFKNAEAWGP